MSINWMLVKKLFVFLVLLFCSAWLTSVMASAPLPYYDWGATTDLSSKVLGAATPSATTQDYLQFDRYFVGGNLTPDNFFYFVKGVQEGIQLTFTFDLEAKEQMRLELAGERLREMQAMVEEAKTEEIRVAAVNYQKAMDSVTEHLENNTATGTEEEIAKHQVVLGEVATQVPEAADEAVKMALQASEKGSDVLADISGKPAIPPDVIDRISALKAQGLLTPEEANKLISYKTRVEAREELRKYTDSGILPAADLLRMNEQMKTSFPQDFYRIHEVERYKEMEKLEAQVYDPWVKEKIQEFAKTYKPGEVIPADIRPYWAPLVRLEEIQNTFRPDLIDQNLFKNNPETENRFKDIVERYKPRQEDVDFVNKYMNNSKVSVEQLPPEYQRMYNLYQNYGVQTAQAPSKDVSCPSNAHFVNGYCIPNYTPRGEGTYCPSGYHRSYENGPCMPDGNVGGYMPSLTTTPGNYPNPYTVSGRCSREQRWVPEPINPSGGYCVSDNYQSPQGVSSVTTTPSSESQEAACRAGGGTCVSWVNGACGCERSGSTATCRQPTGGCQSGKWWDQGSCACRENGSYPSSCAYPAGGCGTNNYWDGGSCMCRQSSTSSSGSYSSPQTNVSRAGQEATCREGGGACQWSGDTCQCQGYRSPSNYVPPTGYGSCSSGQYWNGSNCVNNVTSSGESSSSPSRESQEAACRAGGGTCVSWVNGACGCERSGDGTASSPQPAQTQQPAQTPQPESQPTTAPAPATPSPTNPTTTP